MLRRPDFDTNQWAQENFADASLGDKRRSKRLVEVVSQIVDMPAGSMPQMSPLWKDLKATYRLLDMDQVTLQSVTGPHRKRIAQRGGTQLILSDTCHIDFGAGRQVRGAGPVGPGNSVGFLLHSALAYNAKDKSILGVAGQIAHTRKKDKKTKPSKESERGKQWSESRLWTDLFTQVGPSTDEVHYIHVCDSAAIITNLFLRPSKNSIVMLSFAVDVLTGKYSIRPGKSVQFARFVVMQRFTARMNFLFHKAINARLGLPKLKLLSKRFVCLKRGTVARRSSNLIAMDSI